MNKIHLHHTILKGNICAVIGVSLFLYFAFHAVQGNRGLVRLMFLQKEIVSISSQSEALSSERAHLEYQVKMMRPGSVDKDLLEERVRVTLGYKHSDEYSIVSR